MSENPPENKVSLGCGTLIVIALIVMFFSGGSDSKKLRTRIDDLNHKVDRLEKKIDELTQKVDQQQSSPSPAPTKQE